MTKQEISNLTNLVMAFRKSSLFLFCVPLAILMLLIIATLWNLIKELYVDNNTQLLNYQWTVLGIALFMAIRYLIIKLHWPFRRGTGKANLELLETDTHERIHQFVALCLGRRLSSIHVEQYSGVVYSSGGEVSHLLVSLAPYCMPVITLIFVFARVMIKPEWMWLYDNMIGLSIGFHGVCIYKQMRRNQSDINQYPLFFSYFYIITFLLFNITIILVSIGKDKHIVDTLLYIVHSFWEIINLTIN